MVELRDNSSASVLRSPRRLLLASGGIVCVGLAWAGVILPGLPTTIFLIAASYLFTRSCPWLEERLFRFRVFRPFLPFVRGEKPMPPRARALALLLMWSAVTVSLTTLALGDRLAPWLAVLIVGAAAIGTYSVLTWRGRPLGAYSSKAARRVS